MVQYSREILNLIGGPDLSDLTVCGAKELPELPKFLDAAIWNYIFKSLHPDRAIVHLDLAILKQTNAAAEAYTTGRSHLLRFIDGMELGEHRLMAYHSAVAHFQHCIGAIWKGAVCFDRMQHRALVKEWCGGTLHTKDGSDLHRINELVNISKHFSAEQAEKKSAPVWITSTNIRSADYSVSFDELIDNIVALSEVCRQTFIEIPREALERRKAGQGA